MVDYLVYYRCASEEYPHGLTERTTILHTEEVTSVDDLIYMEDNIEKQEKCSQVEVLAFSKIC